MLLEVMLQPSGGLTLVAHSFDRGELMALQTVVSRAGVEGVEWTFRSPRRRGRTEMRGNLNAAQSANVQRYLSVTFRPRKAFSGLVDRFRSGRWREKHQTVAEAVFGGDGE